jgi:phage shock protein PspC (stress-responsive transcriptional regulator)
MEKTIKINLGGTLFLIDEDAYTVLRNYLHSIDDKLGNSPEGNESIEDIELRIAEIFSSRKGPEKIIGKEDVQAAVSVIGNPEDFEIPEDPSFSYVPQNKKLFRNPDDKVLAGVCGGIGAYLGFEAVWIRILFAVFTLFFGAGAVIYLALWIALPLAKNEGDKREMYGKAYSRKKRYGLSYGTSGIGNTINTIFRAVGKLIFIFFRVLLIIIGAALVLAGFSTLAAFVIVFVFKYPGTFSADIDGMDLSYIPDFLNYIFTPATAAWMTALTSAVVTIPLLLLIYWGVKMIFWFRAKDAIFNLTALVIWVISATALAIIALNQGVNYTQPSESTISKSFEKHYDTLYIKPGKRIADLAYDHEISIPDGHLDIFLNEERKDVYARAYMRIESSDGKNIMMEVTRRSSGRDRQSARERTEGLVHEFEVKGDTVVFDEYLASPEKKWGFDRVKAKLYVPVGTVIGTDVSSGSFENYSLRKLSGDENTGPAGIRFWKMTEEGLK